MITFVEPTLPRTLRIRNPEFEDSEDLSTNTLIHTAMSGRMVSYRRTPATTKLSLVFRDLTRLKAVEIRDFMVATAGMDVNFMDHRGETWRGKILTSPLDIVTDGLGSGQSGHRLESNTLSLEFEGAKL